MAILLWKYEETNQIWTFSSHHEISCLFMFSLRRSNEQGEQWTSPELWLWGLRAQVAVVYEWRSSVLHVITPIFDNVQDVRIERILRYMHNWVGYRARVLTADEQGAVRTAVWWVCRKNFVWKHERERNNMSRPRLDPITVNWFENDLLSFRSYWDCCLDETGWAWRFLGRNLSLAFTNLS